MYNINTNENIRFEWDARKAATNVQKRGVTFKEALTVFYDAHARLIADPDHSIDEERFIILGLSAQANVLTVCHCVRQNGDSIRIISACRATKKRGEAVLEVLS